MLKRFGIPALALASALAIAAPTMSFARGRDDAREGREVARQDFRGRGDDHFDRGDRHFDRGGFNFGVGFYANPVPVPVPVPAPVPSGYYDQYGIWHPYGY
jgi:hypothetical protein